MDVKLNMADEVLQRTLTAFTTSSPVFCLIKLEEYSFPVVRSSFSGTPFSMDYYVDPERKSVVVSKLIYVSSKAYASIAMTTALLLIKWHLCEESRKREKTFLSFVHQQR